MSKSHRSLCVSFSRTGAWSCIYHLLTWSNLNFLHISQWITLPTQSCLALYSFCANLLHLLLWLMLSSQSLHNLHLLFCCVLSILALIRLVLIALFCAAIWRDSVSLLKFPFHSHVQVLSCEMLSISRLKRQWSYLPSCFCFLVFVNPISIILWSAGRAKSTYTDASWWCVTRVWVTVGLLKSPGLFPVFWPILIILYSGWSLFSSDF